MTPNPGLTFVALGKSAPTFWREPAHTPGRRTGWIHVLLMCVATLIVTGVPEQEPALVHTREQVREHAAVHLRTPVQLAADAGGPAEGAVRVDRHQSRPRRPARTPGLLTIDDSVVAPLERSGLDSRPDVADGPGSVSVAILTPHQALWMADRSTRRSAN